MLVELIPLIDVSYNSQNIMPPKADFYAYWEHPEIWDNYNKECFKKAGLKDEMIPYLPGSTFFKPETISDDNLIKIVLDHTKEVLAANEQSCPLFGGYVLCVDGEPLFYPQCCGDLSDINYWRKIAEGNNNAYYEGHPAPKVTIVAQNVILDFPVGKFDEHFVPPVKSSKIIIDILSLKQAVEKAEILLSNLAARLNIINNNHRIYNTDLANMLIWGTVAN